MSFKKISIEELSFNPFEKIGKQWMLLTGGNISDFNTMTASWGQLGVLWNKNVLTCYIRTNRHTFGYIDNGDCFTASFFGEEFRQALSFCGSHSGRDCNKAEEAGITPAEFDSCVGFEEAEMVIVCKKLYTYDMNAQGFASEDGLAEKFYGSDPYHKAFIAEITGVYVKG